jgi:predicted nucleotidyltransferase
MDPQFIENVRQAAQAVFPGSGIFLAYAYGSRVSGSSRPSSDLDVGYYAEVAGDRTGLSIDVDKPKIDQMLGNLKRYYGELQELAAILRDRLMTSLSDLTAFATSVGAFLAKPT